MTPESGGGQLSVTVTEGYALTTSITELPQHQHRLDYVEQPDGSWLIRGTITLMATASALLSGTITLRDPTGETLRMTINIEPALFIDESPIFFDTTKPGKSTAALLTIRQQGATTPVSLRLDPSNAFTVADAKMAFITTSGLNLTPSFEGANVIISYTPRKSGQHSARLVVTTPYDTKIIPLMGQTGGLRSRLPNLPELSVPTLLPKINLSFSLPTLRRSHLVGALFFAVIGGLVWGSYGLLSRSKTTVDLAVLDKPLAQPIRQLALANHLESNQVNQSAQDESSNMAEPEADQPTLHTVVQPIIRQVDQDKPAVPVKSVAIHAIKLKSDIQTKLALVAHNKLNPTLQAKPSIVPTENESDLEKELNTPIYHKDRP